MKTNVNKKMKNILAEQAAEMECSQAEAAREAVCQYFAAAGFSGDRLDAKFGALSDDAIIAVFHRLY